MICGKCIERIPHVAAQLRVGSLSSTDTIRNRNVLLHLQGDQLLTRSGQTLEELF